MLLFYQDNCFRFSVLGSQHAMRLSIFFVDFLTIWTVIIYLQRTYYGADRWRSCCIQFNNPTKPSRRFWLCTLYKSPFSLNDTNSDHTFLPIYSPTISNYVLSLRIIKNLSWYQHKLLLPYPFHLFLWIVLVFKVA